MNTNQWIASASVAAVIVSAFAIATTLKGVGDQLRVTVFVAYTERYSKVMNEVPFEARQPGSGYQLASRPEDERIQVLGAFREYLNLCSEEMWLHRKRRIDHATWSVWEQGMRQIARFPSFLEAWNILGAEYEYYGDSNTLLMKDDPICGSSRDRKVACGASPARQAYGVSLT